MVLVVSNGRPKPVDSAKATDQERVDFYKTMFAYGGNHTFNSTALRLY